MSHRHEGDEVSHLTQHPANDLLLKPDAQAKFCFACASGFEVRVRYSAGVASRENVSGCGPKQGTFSTRTNDTIWTA